MNVVYALNVGSGGKSLMHADCIYHQIIRRYAMGDIYKVLKTLTYALAINAGMKKGIAKHVAG